MLCGTEKKANTIRIASFDIGKVNFAQYTEDVDIKKIKLLEARYKKLPLKFQRKVKGHMNTHIENILNDLYLSGTRVHTGVYNLCSDDEPNKLTIQTRKNILNHLDSYRELWNTCDIFIIEQQYFRTWSGRGKKNKGTEANVDAIKIGELVLGWFLNEYPFKHTEYFGSQFKTQILGAPWKLTKAKRKKWAEQRSREIYTQRGDKDMIYLFELQDSIFKKRLNSEEKIKIYLKSFKGQTLDSKYLAERIVRERQKLDDIGDTCIQLQAFKFRAMVACF